MVKINPKIDANTVVFKYPTLNCMAQATGTTIRDEIIKIPTVLADTDIVTAIKIIKIKFILSTLTPESLADDSSKEMYIKSTNRYENKKNTIIETPRIK